MRSLLYCRPCWVRGGWRPPLLMINLGHAGGAGCRAPQAHQGAHPGGGGAAGSGDAAGCLSRCRAHLKLRDCQSGLKRRRAASADAKPI